MYGTDAAIFGLTGIAAVFFGLWEMKETRDLTADQMNVLRRSGFKAPPGSIRAMMKEDQILRELPKSLRTRQRVLCSLKFGSVAALVIEVFIRH